MIFHFESKRGRSSGIHGSPMTHPARRALQRTFVGLGALALSGLAAAPASAQQPATPSSEQATRKEAEKVFLEARTALEQGRRDEACAGFRRSLDLAEVPNTIFNVARCDEQDGKLVSALGRWQRGLTLLPPGDARRAVAEERVADLERRVPRLSVQLAAGAPPDTRVTLDGAEISPPALGSAVPLDPGNHVVVVEAPGHKERRVPVTLAEQDRRDLPVAPGEAEPKTGGAGAQKAPPPPPPPPPPPDTSRRTLGLVIGGVGAVGLVAAGVTGGILLSRDATIQEQCPRQVCTPEGRDAIDGSKPLLVVNAIAWGVGLVGAGAGAYLFFTGGSGGDDRTGRNAPPSAAIGATALPGGGELRMIGQF